MGALQETEALTSLGSYSSFEQQYVADIRSLRRLCRVCGPARSRREEAHDWLCAGQTVPEPSHVETLTTAFRYQRCGKG